MRVKTPYSITPVSPLDVDTVLAFEHENRHYFERSVPPRGELFFDRSWQIEKLKELSCDPMGRYSLVKEQTGEVVGRINLTFKWQRGSFLAEIGYRVAERQIGKGVATCAVQDALAWLKDDGRFHLAQARVSLENRGSFKVLEKLGFEYVPGEDTRVSLNGSGLLLHLYRLPLNQYMEADIHSAGSPQCLS
ncbi:GNAT family N-acetyltransferase [Flexibacterium corallicola]|uniref:GNAT family N-acetyltransferase n=1 Tax=Flexibacterium corallicola TaxID=3037259 RepID=UPI00286F8678|nr:GNAT family N-acetyltransferase [Pseudovibrio sp. M1P-2-3]